MSAQSPINVVGGGAWGTALANAAAGAGHPVTLWLRDKDPDARRLRRLQVEAQMLWHEHPVNAAREAAPFKSKLGPVAYALGAAIAGAKGKQVHCRVSVDGEQVYEGDVWQALVAASGSFGGIVQLPDSDPETAEMELFVVESRSRLTLIRRVWGMRSGGGRGGLRLFQGHSIRVDVEPDLLWNVDGEVLDLGDVTADPLGPVEIFLPPEPVKLRDRLRRR